MQILDFVGSFQCAFCLIRLEHSGNQCLSPATPATPHPLPMGVMPMISVGRLGNARRSHTHTHMNDGCIWDTRVHVWIGKSAHYSRLTSYFVKYRNLILDDTNLPENLTHFVEFYRIV